MRTDQNTENGVRAPWTSSGRETRAATVAAADVPWLSGGRQLLAATSRMCGRDRRPPVGKDLAAIEGRIQTRQLRSELRCAVMSNVCHHMSSAE